MSEERIKFNWAQFLSIFIQKLIEEDYSEEFVACSAAELFIAIKDMETYLNE